MIRLALYQPEIPQNTGTLLRAGACLGVRLDIIEPCGFGLSDARLKRAGMDYVELANYTRHTSWQSFKEQTQEENKRLVYLTPHSDLSYTDFEFTSQDILILGRESDGLPEDVAREIPYHITIPMLEGRRSLNVALAGAMVLGEALRQTQ
ncbi:MAG: tRNA (cytidine(34)-2'-O)-methyltransferase [Alphaproteobacteria bacterium]|nr:tRNA (cytidine(34)-2'-O)-methyltransferase [Alphaproteobacteria bacterium]